MNAETKTTMSVLHTLVATAMFIGCSQQESPPQQPAVPTIVGTWGTNKIAIFGPDGSLSVQDGSLIPTTDSEKNKQKYFGKYQITAEGVLSIQIDAPSEVMPSGTFDTTITNDYLIIMVSDGVKGKAWFWNRPQTE